jgi:hypothetical protein
VALSVLDVELIVRLVEDVIVLLTLKIPAVPVPFVNGVATQYGVTVNPPAGKGTVTVPLASVALPYTL